MYPEILRIGSFSLNTYGLLLAIAFLAALFVAARLAERDGLPRERIYDLGLWMLLAAIVGSKILMLLTEPSYRENPWHLFSLDFLRSGGVFYGGFIAAVITGYLLVRHYELPWWKTADAFAPGIALGQAIGRQGCFAAGCCWGRPTTLPWGVRFTEQAHELTGVPTEEYLHPTQLYESFAALALFLLLLWFYRRKRFDGQIILLYATLYAVIRFVIEFFRDDPRGDIAGLTTLTGLSTSQLISLFVGIGASLLLVLRWRRAAHPS
ncbi:prolipoprotein diacylglyceryl transferase [Pyrinomonas methylaliphatogenes]|jgi:phosphatidylglycerol:prolipoprotein diacylglycerol transferase|uniref:Phosphatidylglycerol--prolipoprotein diacylglyceryl transferase n=1 Tax=Pyrinomonas methylaliphatogenes TaxID=454194 RepID=A0A0B6X0S7_9BACT|nr:prolipoprotein diacylglyceryl transferase [Pyrinomonas methylaliphatogenes]MBX5478793.1 prolipoprotein diacylglyceryl transferase [Pyrinomonas methylaliphatogenes]CDM66956.1 prolipoprotein diacylglyceryl transferase [Pyrinomonas methylaliphatogenes]